MSDQARKAYALFLGLTERVHEAQETKQRAIEHEQKALQAQQEAWNIFFAFCKIHK